MSRQADVVVPVYGDVEGTLRCLESVLRHSEGQLRRLLVIDDASPDPQMPRMLEALAGRTPDQVVVLRNEQNLGFVGSANRGLALRGGEVVLLNSDTEVTAGWLTALFEALESSPFAAAAVPLSNNATLCSAPDFGGSVDAAVLREADLRLSSFPEATSELPTGVGFCMLLRDAALEAVGLLDPAFGRGYNEENDWCMRARRAGYSILRANRALVFHLGGASFGDEKVALDRRNARLLSHRYPDYLAENHFFAEGPIARRAAGHVAQRLGRARVCLEGEDAWDTDQLARSLGDLLAAASEVPEVVHWRGGRLLPAEVARLTALPSALVVDGPEPWALADAGRPDRSRELGLWQLLLSAADVVTAPTAAAREILLRTFHLAPERVRQVPPLVASALPDREVTGALRLSHWVLLGEPELAPLDAVLTAQALLSARLGELAPRVVLRWPAGWGEPPPGVVPLDSAGMAARLAHLARAVAAVAPGVRGCAVREVLAAMTAGAPVLASTAWGAEEVLGSAGLRLASPGPEALAGELERLVRHPGSREALVQAGRARLPEAPATAAALRSLYGWALENPDPALLARRLALARVLR